MTPAKKILVISNNCLSLHNSNGRTLLNLLGGIDKDDIFQIYFSGETPSEETAGAFVRVTNGDVIKSFMSVKNRFPVVTATPETKTENKSSSGKKNARNMLIRDRVYRLSIRAKKTLFKRVKDFKPDVILLQLGDSALLIDYALYISDKLGAKIITYNTEDYYFKDYDYMAQSEKPSITYKFFHKRFVKYFDRLMKRKPFCIYNCEGLKELYDEKFDAKSEVIYNSSDIDLSANPQKNERKKTDGITYAGNLGVGRHKVLIEIGKAIKEIDESLSLSVYGAAPENIIETELKNAEGINYCGFIPYRDVVDVMLKSKLLVHVESFDDYYKVDTKYAFSTKIADCCASKVPIFICAPAGCEAFRYLSKNDSAFCCSDKDYIKDTIKTALYDEKERKEKSDNALKIFNENHNYRKNGEKFVELLNRLNR